MSIWSDNSNRKTLAGVQTLAYQGSDAGIETIAEFSN